MNVDVRAEHGEGTPGAWVAAILVVAITLLSTFTLSDTPSETVAVVGQTDATGGVVDSGGQSVGLVDGDEGATGQTGGTRGGGTRQVVEGGTAGSEGSAGSNTGGNAGPGGAKESAECAKGQNAGATEDGVTATEIRLGATVVKSGPAKFFLAEAQFGIEAVLRKVNSAGGICGRLVKVDYADDGWVPADGTRIIEKWIGEGKHFGLAVNPSSEGLRGAIDGGLIKNSKFPVIGADGMLKNQYQDPWVWPIATSTHSVMHIMAKNAYERGARTFAIVWESQYKFGSEGANAFTKQVQRLCGNGCIKANTEIGPNTDYGTAANDFVGDCTGSQQFDKCDFVAVLLEPAAATQFVNKGGLGTGSDGRPKTGIGAPQPLFVKEFVRDNCGLPCAEMWVWTSFKPPLEPFASEPAVSTYVSDLRAVSSSADVSNPHVQGAYVGAQLLVDVLRRLGPAPTREGVKQILDNPSYSYDSGMAQPFKFKEGDHYASVSAQAFEAVYNVQGGNASFANWRYTNSGLIRDDDYLKDQ